MRNIFGIIYRDGRPVTDAELATMKAPVPFSDQYQFTTWHGGPAGFGQAGMGGISDATSGNGEHGLVIAWTGRLDNRDELCNALALPREFRKDASDADVVLAAYRKWGEGAPLKIYGDWAFAVWHPAEQKLFLARDHHGNTALFYQQTPQTFAFATSRKSLLALKLAPREIDEMRLAKLLLILPPDGDRTIEKWLRCVPPAHFLEVTPESVQPHRYWFPEKLPELRLHSRQEYVEAFREVFDEAVLCRLPTEGKVGVTLSGGLDSGSVAATAAGMLKETGQRLLALTSVPLSDPSPYVGRNFGDEFPYAKATADHAANIDLIPINACGYGVIASIREALRVRGEPTHTACNQYWVMAVLHAARAAECRTLLTGQCGNAGISWDGDVFSQSLATQLRLLGLRRWTKESIKRLTPGLLLTRYRLLKARQRGQHGDSWIGESPIQSSFARRLGLPTPDAYRVEFVKVPNAALQQRLRILRLGAAPAGGIWAEWASEMNMDIWDPTADPRVLQFVLRVPDRIFVEPDSGLDRWLIRQAMAKRLPGDVRLLRKRGRQAGDIVVRLRNEEPSVREVLSELSNHPADDYLDRDRMRLAWELIHTDKGPLAFRSAGILTRGIMAGLCANQLESV